jgi:hypothetical protein
MLPTAIHPGDVVLFKTAFTLDSSNSIVGTPEQMFQLTGQGRGEARFSENGGAWFFETSRLDFEAVPEPSTVLLVGGALAGSWFRR